MLNYVNKSAKLIILSLLFVELGLVGGAKETGFLWLVSKDNCGKQMHKPGFWVWSLGLVGGAKETGFLWLVSKDNCGKQMHKPGFWVWSLGLVGGAKETGFLWLVSKDNCGKQMHKPGFWVWSLGLISQGAFQTIAIALYYDYGFREHKVLARVWSAAIVGIDAVKVGAEVDVSGGLPAMVVVGLPDTAVQESKERVKAALKNAGYAFPMRRIVINLTPADLRKEGPSFDLPMAIGILAASEQINPDLLGDYLFLGEVSLDGSLRPVAGVLPIAAAAQQQGITALVVPEKNAREAAVVKGLDVYGCRNIAEVADLLNNPAKFSPVKIDGESELANSRFTGLDLKDVKGQTHPRRALEIAAAGGHNLIFVGPPGSGKTMLARRLPGILPPLSFEEALEVTQIHSVAGLLKDYGTLVSDRPFRSPHHSASGPSLVGGGTYPRPGEISLAHRGVLFADELTEFKRDVLEFLRQPLEDGHVTISRTKQTVSFPAQFTLVASTNPCPCGYYGDPIQACTCTPRQREQYWAKLSGPLMDRIDLQVMVNRLKPEEITRQTTGEPSAAVRERVKAARDRAHHRFKEDPTLQCNANMQASHIRQWCPIDEPIRNLLEGAIRKLGLSARATDRVLKVSRTIADLAGDEGLKIHHVAEAIQYRTIDRIQ